jgi:predicted amidohydrolase
MRICVVQTRPVKGEIEKNIEIHKKFIDLAISQGTNMIFFPELSLTGYEPKLAKNLATTQDDKRLDDFQKMSDSHHITVGVGMPIKSNSDISIGMIIFQPHKSRQTYSKQILHSDELPYFVKGQQEIILTSEDKRIAPAICYESLQPEHAERAFKNKAEIYIASVAKSVNGVAKAVKHYPNIAKQYSMTVLMSNCLGPCDDFESVGKSAIWNKNGLLVGQLNETAEGTLLYDTDTEKVKVCYT